MKNANTQILTIVALLSISLSACKKDWFNIKSDINLSVPTTTKELQLLVDNFAVMNTNTASLSQLASDGFTVSESIWQYILTNDSQFSWNIRNALTWTNDGPSYKEVADWINSYQRIAYCNTVLDRATQITPSKNEKESFNHVKGYALFQRARTYLDLAQTFAEPFVKEQDSKYGLPIKQDVSVTNLPKRSTVHETYEFIVNDLIEAIQLLPLNPSIKSRGSKLSSYILLARIKLLMGEYTESITYANNVLSQYSKLLDYNSIDPNLQQLGTYNDEVIFSTYLTNYLFNNPPYCIIDSSLFNKYEENDLRKTYFFTSSPDGIIFKGMYSELGVNVACLAIDEVYLTRAECFARTNQLTKAANDINTLMIHRYKKNPDGSTTYIQPSFSNEDIALETILTERNKELLFRGIRWMDLRRLNQDPRFAKSIERTVGSKKYILDPNSPKYTFPIPLDDISLSELGQNPGW